MALVLDGDNGIIGVLATNTDGDVIFDTNTLFVDAVENKVGIGTITPVRQLHLASSVPSIRLEDTDVSGAYNDIVHLSTGELSIRVDHGNVQSNSSLSFLIDADEKMRIDTDGNVGIGVTPNAGWSANNKVLDFGYHGSVSTDADGSKFGMNMAMNAYAVGGADPSSWKYKTNSAYHASLYHQTAGSHNFYVTNNTAITDSAISWIAAMTIANNGNVGIGGVLQGTSDAEISTSPIRTHSNTISTSTTIDANDNAVASGPLTIADGVTLTINGNMTVV